MNRVCSHGRMTAFLSSQVDMQKVKFEVIKPWWVFAASLAHLQETKRGDVLRRRHVVAAAAAAAADDDDDDDDDV